MAALRREGYCAFLRNTGRPSQRRNRRLLGQMKRTVEQAGSRTLRVGGSCPPREASGFDYNPPLKGFLPMSFKSRQLPHCLAEVDPCEKFARDHGASRYRSSHTCPQRHLQTNFGKKIPHEKRNSFSNESSIHLRGLEVCSWRLLGFEH